MTEAGLVLAAALAGVGLVRRGTRAGALAMAAAGAICLALLVPSLPDAIARRPALLAVAALLAGGVLVGVGLVFARRPGAFALAVVAVFAFRVPVALGGTTANLLVPLYGVIAAGVVAHGLRPSGAPPRRPSALELILAGFGVLYAAQAAYSSDVDAALRNVVFFYVPFTLLLALLLDVKWTEALRRKSGRLFCGLALLFCLVAFVQVALGTTWINEKLAESNTYNPYFRANSLFFDPNVFGRYLIVAMLLVAALLARSRGRRDLLPGLGVLVVLFLGLLTSLSSSSFLALLAGIGVLAALLGRTRSVVSGLAALAVGGLLVLVAFPGAIGLRPGDETSVAKATSGRDALIRGGVDLFEARPVLGWGSGAFSKEYRRREVDGGRTRQVAASHTIALTVAVEQGVVGLAAYLALLVAAAWTLLRAVRRSAAAAGVAAAFAALVVHTLAYAAFLEDPLTWVLLAVGLTWHTRTITQAGDAQSSPAPAPHRRRRMGVLSP